MGGGVPNSLAFFLSPNGASAVSTFTTYSISFSENRDVVGEVVFLDKGVRPDGVDQGLFLHGLAGALKQH